MLLPHIQKITSKNASLSLMFKTFSTEAPTLKAYTSSISEPINISSNSNITNNKFRSMPNSTACRITSLLSMAQGKG